MQTFVGFICGVCVAWWIGHYALSVAKKRNESQRQLIENLYRRIRLLKDEQETTAATVSGTTQEKMPEQYHGALKDMPEETEDQKSLKEGWIVRAKKAGISEKHTQEDVINAEDKKRKKALKKKSKLVGRQRPAS